MGSIAACRFKLRPDLLARTDRLYRIRTLPTPLNHDDITVTLLSLLIKKMTCRRKLLEGKGWAATAAGNYDGQCRCRVPEPRLVTTSPLTDHKIHQDAEKGSTFPHIVEHFTQGWGTRYCRSGGSVLPNTQRVKDDIQPEAGSGGSTNRVCSVRFGQLPAPRMPACDDLMKVCSRTGVVVRGAGRNEVA